MVPSPAVALTVTLPVRVAPAAGAAPAAAAIAPARAAAPSSAAPRLARIVSDLLAGMPGGLASMLISLSARVVAAGTPRCGGVRRSASIRAYGKLDGLSSAARPPPAPVPAQTTRPLQNGQFRASAAIPGAEAAERGVKCNQAVGAASAGGARLWRRRGRRVTGGLRARGYA